jgi:hypothetical protein
MRSEVVNELKNKDALGTLRLVEIHADFLAGWALPQAARVGFVAIVVEAEIGKPVTIQTKDPAQELERRPDPVVHHCDAGPEPIGIVGARCRFPGCN